MRRDPHQLGGEQARWTLRGLGQVIPWLQTTSAVGIWGVLHRRHIHWKRARSYIHSPDPAYHGKRADIRRCAQLVRQRPDSLVLLYQDEVTFYQQPTLANAYDAAGPSQPFARRSHGRDLAYRTIGTLDLLSGQVVALGHRHLDLRTIVRFYQQVCAAYPHAERIYLVQDNWPVHFHPDVLVALEPQETPWPLPRPKNWPSEPSIWARAHWAGLHLPIQVVPLPTYASWLNPIEKLWRWLKQEVLHRHRLAGDPAALRTAVQTFLTQFAAGSADLLRYVGLLPTEVIT